MNCKNVEVVKINEFILLPVCITSRRQRLRIVIMAEIAAISL